MLHQDDGGRATDATGAGGAASRMRSELRVQLCGLRTAAKTRALAAAVALRIRIGWVPSPCDASGRLRDHAHS